MSHCYFGAESCRKGHTHDCPAKDRDPWSEVTQERFTADEASDLHPVLSGSIMVLNGVRHVITPYGWRPEAE